MIWVGLSLDLNFLIMFFMTFLCVTFCSYKRVRHFFYWVFVMFHHIAYKKRARKLNELPIFTHFPAKCIKVTDTRYSLYSHLQVDIILEMGSCWKRQTWEKTNAAQMSVVFTG